MFRKILCTLAVAGFAVGLAAAQTAPAPSTQPNTSPTAGPNLFQGRIAGINGNTVMFQPFDPVTNQLGNMQAFPVGNQVQLFQTQGTQRAPLTGGLTATPFRNIGPNGQWASFRMNNNNLAEIQLMNTPANLTNLPPIPKTNPNLNPNGLQVPNPNVNSRQPLVPGFGINASGPGIGSPNVGPNQPIAPNPITNPTVNPNQPGNPVANPTVNPNQPAVPNPGVTPPAATPNQTRGP